MFWFFRQEIHKSCKVVDVIPPILNDSDIEILSSNDSDENDEDDDNDEDKDAQKENETPKKRQQKLNQDPNKYKYLIETQSSNGQLNRLTVKASQLR